MRRQLAGGVRRAGGLSAALGTALLVLSLCGGARAADDVVAIGAARHAHYARLSFGGLPVPSCEAVVAGNMLALHFKQPIAGDLAVFARRLPDLVASAGYGATHDTVMVTLKKPVAVQTVTLGGVVAIDLHPVPNAGTPVTLLPKASGAADKPADTAAGEPAPETASVRDAAIHLAVGHWRGEPRIALTSRVPFDVAISYAGNAVMVRLPRPPASMASLAALPELHPSVDGSTLTFELPADRELERWGHGRQITLGLVVRKGAPREAAAVPAMAPAAADTEAADDPIALRVDRPHRGIDRLVLSSARPFELALAQAGRAVTVTLSRPLLARRLTAIAAWQPHVDGTSLTLTLPPGRALRQTRHNGHVLLDLVPASESASTAPPPAAAAVPAASTRSASARSALTSSASAPSASTPPAPTPPAPTSMPAASAAVSASVPRTLTPATLADGGSLRFAPVPGKAAVFRRGDDLWVAFSGAAKIDLAAVRAKGAPFVTAAEAVAGTSGTVLRFRLATGLEPALRQSASEWIIDLEPRPASPDAPVQGSAAEAPPRLHFTVAQPGVPITVTDPTIGDTLVIVPLGTQGQGVAREQDLVDVAVLPTIEGLAFAPKSDGVHIADAADGVDVTSARGLLVSTEVPTERFRARRNRIFDFAAWAGPGGTDGVLAHRRALEAAIVSAKPGERTWPRINLARFYVAIGYGPEAQGVLADIARRDPSAMLDPSLRALRGAAAMVADDDADAARDLATPLVANDPDLELWRGLLLEDRGDAKDAVPAFAHGMGVLPSYPKLLRTRIALAAARARIASGLDDAGLLRKVLDDDPSPGDRYAALYLEGRMLANRGDDAGALKLWGEVAAGDDRPSRARADYARTQLLLKTHEIDRATAIRQLDTLRFAWRGGNFEFNLLRRIGELKVADGDYRGGFAAMREAVSVMPKNPEAAATTKEIADAFAGIFLGPQAASIPPLTALSVYEENRQLMPEGDAGDAITSKLADRLASVDLLDSAADLLDTQATTRLHGLDKARVLTRVAVLQLLNRKPAAALAALTQPISTALPAALATQRQELQARALVDLGKPADALTALDGDTSLAATTLRAQIAVKTQNWATAATIFAQMAANEPPAGPLSAAGAQAILNSAVALTLAKDKPGLAALRQKYAAAMDKTPFADGFRIVAGADTTKTADLRELSSQLAQVSDLQSFMRNYRQMVARESLSAIN